MSDKQEIVPALASNLVNNAVSTLRQQRTDLNQFIKECLIKSVDYGLIPGTQKDTLFKPGAEKLANLFKLGMRIVDTSKDMDLEKDWAMFTYRVELIHLPTGAVVSQCEGSANSREKKYEKRAAVDQLNTLQKMAQKRAYVGAVITATGASDFFTQDLEDMDRSDLANVHNLPASKDASVQELANYVFKSKVGRLEAAGKKMGSFALGDLRAAVKYWTASKTAITGPLRTDITAIKLYLSKVDDDGEIRH